MNQSDVDQFCDLAGSLIQQVGNYGANTQRSEADSAAVRQLRAVAGALVAALDQVRMMPVPATSAATPMPAAPQPRSAPLSE
jgi:hypothetical protein